jgi:hypothetical protein
MASADQEVGAGASRRSGRERAAVVAAVAVDVVDVAFDAGHERAELHVVASRDAAGEASVVAITAEAIDRGHSGVDVRDNAPVVFPAGARVQADVEAGQIGAAKASGARAAVR